MRRLAPTLVVLALTLASVAAALAPALDADERLLERPLSELNVRGMRDAAFAARVQHHLAEHGIGHPQKLDLRGEAPFDVARRILNDETFQGRTPAAWLAGSTAAHLLALRPDAAPAGDLVSDVERLASAAGVAYTRSERAELAASAAALPADVRAPFADLVRAVADAYEAQLPTAERVASRVTPSADVFDMMLTQEERDATLANLGTLVAAQNLYRERMADVAVPTSSGAPLFRDPAGLVILGGLGHDTYGRTGVLQDPILLVDVAGNDVYRTSAGGACPLLVNNLFNAAPLCNGLALSLHVDLLGDDRYEFTGEPSVVHGAGAFGGLGVLVDASGADRYHSSFRRVSTGYYEWYVDGVAQGAGEAGVGLLLDATGNDVYRADVSSAGDSIWNLAQGYGGVGGVGIASDGSGDDQWLSNGLSSVMWGFQGVYANGVSIWAGVGILTDTGRGNDAYHAWDNATTTDFYSQGFGALGGLGILYEDGGDDDYAAVEIATDPWIVPLLNCAFGTGSYAGVGIFLEMGGNDRYYGDSISPHGATTTNEGFGGPGAAYGIFVDVSGDDGHFMYANGVEPGTGGRGVVLAGLQGSNAETNLAGVFLDLGGSDQYKGAKPSGDGKAWAMGADVNALPDAPRPMLLPEGL